MPNARICSVSRFGDYGDPSGQAADVHNVSNHIAPDDKSYGTMVSERVIDVLSNTPGSNSKGLGLMVIRSWTSCVHTGCRCLGGTKGAGVSSIHVYSCKIQG